MSHTPGPWKVVPGERMVVRDIKDSAGRVLIAAGALPRDADLIAAAPDLLTGLEAAVEALDAFDVANEMTAELRWMRATIAAAKGSNQ